MSSAREFRGDNNEQSWLVNYDYDLFGNRYQKQAQNSGNPFSQVWVESGQINQANNRFNSNVTYDDAGNITVDSKFRNLQFQYDANNRQKESANLDGSGVVVSVYDAGGQRLATQVGGSLTNVLVYDAGGKLVAEYSSAGGTGGTQYLFSDQQGSPRTVTSTSGAVISRHDYLPYGEEIGAVGMRTSGQGYSAGDNTRQKYAGMENDDATGMSHTLWRQYDSSSGRWTSPDPYGGSMSPSNPQSFNRYSYVNNDPVNLVDPTGLALSDIGVTQTEDPEYAKTLQGNSDARFKKAINDDHAGRHGGTVSYDKNGHASFQRGGNVVGVVTIHGHFEDVWGNPNYSAMANALWGLARTGYHFGGPSGGGAVSSGGAATQRGDPPSVHGSMVPIVYPPGFVNAVIGLLPRKIGKTLGAQALFASGDQIIGGTVNGFATFDFGTQSIILGETHGGGIHSAEEGYLGVMASAGVGDGWFISNARDDEMDGPAQAIMGGWGLLGGEIDISRGKDGRFVYSLGFNGGKSLGGGVITMPVQTNTTGDIRFRPK